MDKQTVFTKTAKGLAQVERKTQSLSRQVTSVLRQIDGRISVCCRIGLALELGARKVFDTVREGRANQGRRHQSRTTVAEERVAREPVEATIYADKRGEEVYRLAQVTRLKELIEQAKRSANQQTEAVDGNLCRFEQSAAGRRGTTLGGRFCGA